MDGNPDKNNFYEINQAYLEYKPLFDKAKEIFDFADDCAEDANNQRIKLEELSDYRKVVSLLFCESRKTFRSVLILCNKGQDEDAVSLTRTIFENYLAIRYIQENPDKYSKRFLSFLFLEAKATLDWLKNRQPDFSDNLRDIILKNKDWIVENYEKAERFFIEENDQKSLKKSNYRSWSGMPVKKMADKVGLNRDYDYVYRFHSGFIHPDMKGLQSFWEVTSSGIRFKCEASTKWIFLSLIQSLRYFLNILNEWLLAFDLNKSEHIARFQEQRQNLENDFLKKED